MEAVIVSGLKRSGRGPAAGGAVRRWPGDGAAVRIAAVSGVLSVRFRAWSGSLAGWASGRSLEPSSLAGVSLLLALCSAAWFSGGNGPDALRGVIAAAGWYLISFGARRLAQCTPARAGSSDRPAGRAGPRGQRAALPGSRPALRASSARRAARVQDGGTDWLALPGLALFELPPADLAPPGHAPPGYSLPGYSPPGSSPPGLAPPGLAPPGLTRPGLAPPELAPPGHAPPGRSLPGPAPVGPGPAHVAGPGRASGVGQEGRTADGWLVSVGSIAGECAIYGGIAAGARSAGSALWELAVMTVAAIALAGVAAACRPAAAAGTERNPVLRRLTSALGFPSAGARVLCVLAGLLLGGPRPALLAVLTLEVTWTCCAIALAGWQAGRQPAARAAATPEVVLACRNDGPVARWAGRLVQGNLIPLPPAIAGLFATAMLAVLGLRSLPGLIALAPPVAMMLAAPGSSHPHDGGSDWLVPVVLAAAQFTYFAPLGFALGVPGPVVFAACGLVAVWYAGVAAGGPDGVTSAAGWEGRMFAVSLTAIFGLPLFGYLGLSAYLAVLICRKVMIGHLRSGEVERG